MVTKYQTSYVCCVVLCWHHQVASPPGLPQDIVEQRRARDAQRRKAAEVWTDSQTDSQTDRQTDRPSIPP